MYKLCCIVFFCFWPFVSISNANEPSSWPAFMGPDRNGLVAARGVFAEGGFSLKKDWIVDLGSGYSGISIAQNIAVTMYSDHQSDYVLALNATTGEKIWQYLLGPTYKGHGNSQDGPLSTPSIDQNVVFCLSPFANLVALDLATGDLRWQVDLIKEFNAPAPHWGFVTSPLLCDGVLVVLAGLAENGLLIGFDSRTGEKLWQGGHDVVRYQSPTRGLLNGRDVVLAAGDEELFCLNPKTGEILWQYAADGGFIDSTTPLIISPNKVLVQTAQNGLQLLGIQEVDGISAVDIIWENSRVNRSYSLPLVYGDQIYVYSGRFLSCISTDTGQINWKSRAPGDGFMIGVGQYLVILTKQGWIHVAATDPQAYKENAALKLFDDLAWTHPSFYDGKIYARSYGQIACIGVDNGKRIASSSSSALASQSNFLNWINKVKSANPEEKSILVNQYMAETKTFPIIEPDGLVHFVYQGDADDLALSGDHVGLWDERPMQRLEDTDIFYASYYLELDARLKYRFIKNLEEKILDPLNPIEVEDTMGGESEFFSWLTMPNWSAATFAVLDQSHRGGIETRYMTSTILADQRGMDIYLPPGYRQTDKDYPVAYLHMGKGAQQFGAINRVVDQLIKDKKIEALILVLVHENASGFYREIFWDVESMKRYSMMFLQELIPFIDENYRTIQAPAGRANIGSGSAGCVSLYTTLNHSDIFSYVASQSSVFWAGEREQLIEELIDELGYKPLNIYLEWGKYDFKRHEMDVKGIGDRNRIFYDRLTRAGYTVAGGEINAGFGWSSWKHQFDDILQLFFPYAVHRGAVRVE